MGTSFFPLRRSIRRSLSHKNKRYGRLGLHPWYRSEPSSTHLESIVPDLLIFHHRGCFISSIFINSPISEYDGNQPRRLHVRGHPWSLTRWLMAECPGSVFEPTRSDAARWRIHLPPPITDRPSRLNRRTIHRDGQSFKLPFCSTTPPMGWWHAPKSSAVPSLPRLCAFLPTKLLSRYGTR